MQMEAYTWIAVLSQAGHALIGALMPEYDPVAKISIVPRGAAGGLTFFSPSEERLESGLYRCDPSPCVCEHAHSPAWLAQAAWLLAVVADTACYALGVHRNADLLVCSS
jgi:hypothetical protein